MRIRPRVKAPESSQTSNGACNEKDYPSEERKKTSIRERSPLLVSKMLSVRAMVPYVSILILLFVPSYVIAVQTLGAKFVRDKLVNAHRSISENYRSTYFAAEPQKSILDRYLDAMTNSAEYRDSDFPFTEEVQKSIYRHQHPKSCSESSFLIFYVYVSG